MFRNIITFAIIATTSYAGVFQYSGNAKMVNDILLLHNARLYETKYFYPEKKLNVNLVYPGTKWCGMGNTATDYDDLGTERETDMCCRDHDHCPDVLSGWETEHNLTNNAIYSRLSCECDEKFRQCLRRVNTGFSNKIGTMYFNAIGTRCFRKDYPVIGCKKWGGFFNMKCIEPEYDKTKEKIYQWFDLPKYWD